MSNTKPKITPDTVHFELGPDKYDAFVKQLATQEKIPPSPKLKKLMQRKPAWEK
ncbi:MAG: hypothetical protein HYT93_00780 [Parcubacteria group bacterium]|nr:hypothetical protein [Parcubacteria group bacterium]